ncbi:NADH dehydrogenase [ubiquinone] 1 beta subcomplex subunit 9-like [Pectinophora gossypiella]|uniref:NADH dehydrogenase [ubiquinone] 1 beta subcomplex subunit 9-like n=1 Tax=Pectinophora gossypiella TaxID=13191 RepID=UPI00214EE0EF|nr:NADH dehydrogenase [ubiquinone] 1 beta subcomplex subunit 9-like [Pectinophora gossypiella]
MAFAPELRTHAQHVCTLYKQAMRNIEGYYVGRTLIRYQQVQLRARFDENKDVSDPKEQRRLLWVGRDELFLKKHPLPLAKFAKSLGIAGGVAYARVVEPPDWVMDYWHPLEKAQYPVYFRTREERKCEFIDKWYRGELC